MREEAKINALFYIEFARHASVARNNAEKMLDCVRSHWTIETSLHWVLDMAFQEDQCRLRMGHGAQNFAILRHLALSLLKQDKSNKDGIQSKRLQAGWDIEYLLKVLKPAS